MMDKSTEDFQAAFFYVVVAFIVVNLFGFFGNISVLYVYALRYPKGRFRCLVLALSIVDFTACCTTVPMETVSTWYWFNAPSRLICKAKNFCVQLTGLSAMYMLFITAVYKYRQICKPFGKQVSEKLIVLMCVSGIALSMLFATPAAILWDLNTHTVGNTSEYVLVCEVHEMYHDTNIPAIYRHVLSSFNIFLLMTIILYTLVAREIILHFRRMKALSKADRTVSRLTVFTVGRNAKFSQERTSSSRDSCRSEETWETESSSQGESVNVAVNRTRSASSNVSTRSVSQLTPALIRKIIMMVIIACTFSVTFVMALTFGYVFAIRGYEDFSDARELALLFCCYRLYFVNYAMNPVVYFIFDRCFRKQIIISLCSCCRGIRATT